MGLGTNPFNYLSTKQSLAFRDYIMNRIYLFVLIASTSLVSGCQSTGATEGRECVVPTQYQATILPRGEREDSNHFRWRLDAQSKSTSTILPRGEYEDSNQFRWRLDAQTKSISTIMPRGEHEDSNHFRWRLDAHRQMKQD
jgi:hypothetical protein